MDIIIIGNGPAGISAAISAVQAGLKIMVIGREKRKKDTTMPLQSVHPGLEVLLKKLEAEKAVKISSRATYHNIIRNGIDQPLNAGTGPAWYGHHIERNVFDNYLAFCARKKGVQFYFEDHIRTIIPKQNSVTIKMASGIAFESKFVLDCTGAKRITSNKLGYQENLLSPLLYCWTGIISEQSNHMHPTETSFNVDINGWTWIAPVDGEKFTWTRLSLLAERPTSLTYPNGKPFQIKKYTGAQMQWSLSHPAATPRVVMAGDAAGILDPGAGQGIFNACQSGINAVEAIIRSLTKGKDEVDDVLRYGRAFKQDFINKCNQLLTAYREMGMNI